MYFAGHPMEYINPTVNWSKFIMPLLQVTIFIGRYKEMCLLISV